MADKLARLDVGGLPDYRIGNYKKTNRANVAGLRRPSRVVLGAPRFANGTSRGFRDQMRRSG